MSDVQTHDVRSDALRMVNALPQDATWDDLMQQIYVRQCIERGIKDAEEGRVLDVAEVRRKFGLQS
jgi:predicted transcriptional regulator